ncbi:hypothetical protein PanWU01x14_307930 [Parasponia andersonii]|uniref:Uncharacterized protein n=1 Tax=Parasponia andersonii TaxID=3476 RepID=A0A2P5AR78_PARAD|nr:hypothetical protein PanWU01x14_307930 [Parasponia andersonii]
MATRLDQYNTAYLLSGHGLNDFRLKSSTNADLIDSDLNMDDHTSPTPDFVADVAHVGCKTHVENSGSLLRGSTNLAHGKDLHGIVSAARLDVAHDSINLGVQSDLARTGISAKGGFSSSRVAVMDSSLPKVSLGVASPPNCTLDGSKSKSSFLDANLGLGLDSVQMKGTGYDVISSDWEVARKVCRDSLKSDPDLGVGVDVAGSGALARKNVVSGSFLNSTIGVNVASPSFAQVIKDQDNDFLGAGPSINIGVNPAMCSTASLIALELSKPTIKGNYVCVKVNDQSLQKRFDLCKFSLIGCIFLSKGDSLWKLADLKFKLQSICNFSFAWRLISLGKGFFHLLLSSEEEKNQVYWDRQILSDLARGLGVPIRFDEMTLKAAKSGEQKIERGCSRSRKRIYHPITKSPNVVEVPVTNAFSTLKKDLGPKEGVEEK